MLGPHHDVGFTEDLKQRQQEYTHHGDALVPRQQRFGQYTRSMMKGLGVPVINQFGLRPALVKGTSQIAPLTINKDLDKLGLLNGVSTFNFHPHLPHYALTAEDQNQSTSLPDSRLILNDRILSSKRATPNSTLLSGCHRIHSARDTSCWRTPRSLLPCLVGWSLWRRSGRILQ